ncbi:hypothetical protein [Amycolatopsis sp. lyj-346]|uniref:hypothetical protein n=1 Tax=Amycolatopsis sp. lyj-346 TaxID=2789289 RepID=UPI00397910A5
MVRAITSPENKGSHAFHTRMGFVTEPGPKGFRSGRGHDGPGPDRLSFRKDPADTPEVRAAGSGPRSTVTSGRIPLSRPYA